MINEVDKKNISSENMKAVSKAVSHFYNIGVFRTKQITLYKISFSQMLSLRNEYNITFGKDVIDFIFKSSGACVIEKETQYMIFLNIDLLDTLSEETQKHLVLHEEAHIMLGHLNQEWNFLNKKINKRNDKQAEYYANEKGFKLKDSIFKLSKWETYSLFPESNKYKYPKKVWFLRKKFYIRNLFVNFYRKYFI